MDTVGMYDHTILFDILYSTEFTWIVPFDENRAEEGINLRFIFQQSRGVEYDEDSMMDGYPCSVLEMLIGLARSMEDTILYDPELGDRIDVWFWLMLRNLGLDFFSDNHIRRSSSQNAAIGEIHRILEVFLTRRYDRNGVGGIFPLNRPSRDQREVELWQQANQYAMDELL